MVIIATLIIYIIFLIRYFYWFYHVIPTLLNTFTLIRKFKYYSMGCEITSKIKGKYITPTHFTSFNSKNQNKAENLRRFPKKKIKFCCTNKKSDATNKYTICNILTYIFRKELQMSWRLLVKPERSARDWIWEDDEFEYRSELKKISFGVCHSWSCSGILNYIER